MDFSLQWLLLCTAQTLGCTGSVVVARGLSRPTVRGISQVQESNLCPLQGRWILNHWTTRKVPVVVNNKAMPPSSISVIKPLEHRVATKTSKENKNTISVNATHKANL